MDWTPSPVFESVVRRKVVVLQFKESYADYCARRADELAAEAQPVAVVDYELVELCRECRGTGRREVQFGRYWADYVVEDCCFCKGTGAAARYPIYAEPPRPAA
jgi:hypothetical protein